MAGDIPLPPERPLDPVLDLDHPETLQRPTRGRFRPAPDPLRVPDPLQPATETLRGDRNPQVHEEYETVRNPGGVTAALGAGSLYRPKNLVVLAQPWQTLMEPRALGNPHYKASLLPDHKTRSQPWSDPGIWELTRMRNHLPWMKQPKHSKPLPRH